MKIVFMGTPDFAVPALKALNKEHEIVAVYTREPKPAGRGQELKKSPVHLTSMELGLPVYTPVSLKKDFDLNELSCLGADLAVVCAYGLILPEAVLNLFPMGCINIHASILPRWRGAAPINRAIMAGDTKTGITIMQMDAGLDTGDILSVEEVEINREMNVEDLHDRLSVIGGRLIVKTLKKMPRPQPQNDDGATYAHKIEKEDCLIDWNKNSDEIYNQIRGLSPYPKAYFMYHNERFFVLKAEICDEEKLPLSFKCGDGKYIRILTIQRAGKKAMPIEEFLKGFKFYADL